MNAGLSLTNSSFHVLISSHFERSRVQTFSISTEGSTFSRLFTEKNQDPIASPRFLCCRQHAGVLKVLTVLLCFGKEKKKGGGAHSKWCDDINPFFSRLFLLRLLCHFDGNQTFSLYQEPFPGIGKSTSHH